MNEICKFCDWRLKRLISSCICPMSGFNDRFELPKMKGAFYQGHGHWLLISSVPPNIHVWAACDFKLFDTNYDGCVLVCDDEVLRVVS